MRNPVPAADPALESTVLARRLRRVVPTLAAAAAIAICVMAGNWQQRRMEAKVTLRAQYEAASAIAPVALATVPADADWVSLKYRAVTATGEYLASRQILIDNKVAAGRAGFHVVTPLALRDGRIVLVNRGWIAQRGSRSMLPEAPPPAGDMTVHGRIAIPATSYLELKPDSTSGPVRQNLDPGRFAAASGLAVLPIVVEATEPAALDDGLVRAWPAPDFGVDTHRIYMVQWYAFALLVALLWLWFNRPRRSAVVDG